MHSQSQLASAYSLQGKWLVVLVVEQCSFSVGCHANRLRLTSQIQYWNGYYMENRYRNKYVYKKLMHAHVFDLSYNGGDFSVLIIYNDYVGFFW